MSNRSKALALVGLMLAISASIYAQTSVVTVAPGQKTQLAEAKEAINVTTPPTMGKVTQDGTAGNHDLKLFYTANDVKDKTTDSIVYVLDGTPAQKTTINIEPKTGLPDETYSAGGKALFLLFALALILESALAVLFNWRPFVETFNARAVRPLVSFTAALVLVKQFNLDVITTFVNAATNQTLSPALPGTVLTALVLAGGSAGVNNLLVALGYREKKTPETVVPRPPQNRAWVAVRLNRKEAVGGVSVFIGTPPPAGGHPPLVGVIGGRSKPGFRYFLSDPGRFPSYGGHLVPANTEIRIDLVGVDNGGQVIQKAWGPATVADGAIIDLELEL